MERKTSNFKLQNSEKLQAPGSNIPPPPGLWRTGRRNFKLQAPMRGLTGVYGICDNLVANYSFKAAWFAFRGLDEGAGSGSAARFLFERLDLVGLSWILGLAPRVCGPGRKPARLPNPKIIFYLDLPLDGLIWL